MRTNKKATTNRVRYEGHQLGFWRLPAVLTSMLLISVVAMGQDAEERERPAHLNRILRSLQRQKERQPVEDESVDPKAHYRLSRAGHLRALVAPDSHHFPVSSVVRGDDQATAKNFMTENREAFGTTRFGFALRAKRVRQREKHSL